MVKCQTATVASGSVLTFGNLILAVLSLLLIWLFITKKQKAKQTAPMVIGKRREPSIKFGCISIDYQSTVCIAQIVCVFLRCIVNICIIWIILIHEKASKRKIYHILVAFQTIFLVCSLLLAICLMIMRLYESFAGTQLAISRKRLLSYYACMGILIFGAFCNVLLNVLVSEKHKSLRIVLLLIVILTLLSTIWLFFSIAYDLSSRLLKAVRDANRMSVGSISTDHNHGNGDELAAANSIEQPHDLSDIPKQRRDLLKVAVKLSVIYGSMLAVGLLSSPVSISMSAASEYDDVCSLSSSWMSSFVSVCGSLCTYLSFNFTNNNYYYLCQKCDNYCVKFALYYVSN